jgi:hypothetical protein
MLDTVRNPTERSYLSVDWQNPVDWSQGLNRGLVGWWLVQHNAIGGTVLRDLALGNDGILTGLDPATDWISDAPKGHTGSIDFSGSNQYVATPNNAVEMGITRYATFSSWALVQNFATQRALLGDWNASLGFAIRTELNETTTFFVDPNDHRIDSVSGAVVGEWNHIVGTMDGANMYLYINGRQVGTQTLGEDIGSSAAKINIGIRGDLADDFIGPIASTMIWNRALSVAEVRHLYEDSRLGYPTLLRRWWRPVSTSTAEVAGTAVVLTPYRYLNPTITDYLADPATQVAAAVGYPFHRRAHTLIRR